MFWFGGEVEGSAEVFFDDLFGDVEADAGALGGGFGGEHGLENFGFKFCGDAGAFVLDGDSKLGLGGFEFDGDSGVFGGSLGIGIDGVGNKIGDDLVEFEWVAIEGGFGF